MVIDQQDNRDGKTASCARISASDKTAQERRPFSFCRSPQSWPKWYRSARIKIAHFERHAHWPGTRSSTTDRTSLSIQATRHIVTANGSCRASQSSMRSTASYLSRNGRDLSIANKGNDQAVDQQRSPTGSIPRISNRSTRAGPTGILQDQGALDPRPWLAANVPLRRPTGAYADRQRVQDLLEHSG